LVHTTSVARVYSSCYPIATTVLWLSRNGTNEKEWVGLAVDITAHRMAFVAYVGLMGNMEDFLSKRGFQTAVRYIINMSFSSLSLARLKRVIHG
jgi:hypothetical protein